MRSQRLVLVLVMLLLVGLPFATADGSGADYAKQIQPLFKARCYQCHAGQKHKSGFRLDVRSIALHGGDSGKPGIVPGHGDKSELIRRVSATDDDVMPPKGPRLSASEVQLLRRWIDAGARWPDALAGNANSGKTHWSFIPPRRPALPPVKNKAWVRNDIDRFILARLEKEGLQPSPEADRTTLIRRLYLDLLGLPPTPAEVDAFVTDSRPDTYEQLVDRLLASPHYGERWGRRWLDAARYADSDGFEKDKARFVWFYRDWVINAFNHDMPYNEFIIEQLAGDLLPHATQDQRVATGYLRNSMINEEGGVDPEQFRMEAMYDRMDAIGKGILGLTIQCAQCHDHKYDPLTQREYYRMFAFLNNDHEANIAVYTPEEQMKRSAIFRDMHALESKLRHRHPDWRARMHAWENTVRDNQPKWIVLRPHVDEESTGGEKYLQQPDGSWLCLSYAPTKHTVTMTVQTNVQKITAFRLDMLNDPNLPRGGPGRSIFGTGALTEFKVEIAPASAPNKKQWVKFVEATADVNPPEKPLDKIYDDRSNRRRVTGPASYAIDDKDETAWGWDIDPIRSNQPHNIVFLADKPIGFAGGTILTFHIKQDHGGWNSDDNQNNNLGRFKLSLTTQPGAEADPIPPRVRQVMAIAPERRTPAQEAVVFSYWRTIVPQWQEINAQIEKLCQQMPLGTTQLVLQNREHPRTTHILKRGDWLKPGKAVTPGVPAFLNPLPARAPLNRLTFARWLVGSKSPTTARALVNRIWQGYFGIGIVATSEDLGTQCEAPSHPQLLDWLAVEFMEDGWSRKKLHRLIVTSATYRQSSKVTPALYARDPYNRLLARGPRIRVDAEIVRDIGLAASGLLNEQIGGRSVYPPLPHFLVMPPASYGPKPWPEDKGQERYRRALYTFRFRSVPYPVLQTFDAPNGDFACVRRARSNTPLQALMTLNEPMSMECARALAWQTVTKGGKSDRDRLLYAFRRCLARRPTSDETTELLGLLDRQEKHFNQPKARPWELAAADPTHPQQLSKGDTPARVAAWTVVCRVLLNLDETITKE